MHTIFLSYSRADLFRIEQLVAQLKRQPELSIWRDQKDIYVGEKWPKRLGEAIADQDLFLLAWSKNSKASSFVEFEWCTALALNKTIVPCFLDDTELASSLKTFQGCVLDDTARLIQLLRAAPLADVGLRKPVIDSLNTITATDEKAVLEQAKTIFSRQKLTAGRDIYQAAGDIHFHAPPVPQKVSENNKSVLEKWQTWAALVVAILIAISLAADLPGKLGLQFFANEDEIMEQSLAGFVQDAETKKLLAGVNVRLLESGETRTTNPDGHFDFRLRAAKQDQLTILAEREGYDTYERKHILGDMKVKIPLKKRVP